MVSKIESGISSVKEMIRIRHYASNSGIKGIECAGVIKASDQNKIFCEPGERKAPFYA